MHAKRLPSRLSGSLLAQEQGSGEPLAGSHCYGHIFTTTLYRLPTAGPNMSNAATTTMAINRIISAYSTNPCPSSRGKKSIVAPPSFARSTREETKTIHPTRLEGAGGCPTSGLCIIQQKLIKRNSTLGLLQSYSRVPQAQIHVNLPDGSTGQTVRLAVPAWRGDNASKSRFCWRFLQRP